MIPRIEQKLEFNRSQYSFFLKWLKNKRAEVLYPERIICSRYFDNSNFQMFNDTVEGIVPRKKIRIRTYSTELFTNSDNPYSLEIKMTTEHKRLKKVVTNIDYEQLSENGYLDNYYGICTEKVDISYVREYFIMDDVRVTIDRDIVYKAINFNFMKMNKEHKEESFVLEIKSDPNKSLTVLSNTFDFPRTRFSKYERAIETLF